MTMQIEDADRKNVGHLDHEALKDLHLTIDSHVVVQLGAELVTDAAQALQELVKNAYDADATYCKVEVETGYVQSSARGKIEGGPASTVELINTGAPNQGSPPPHRGRIVVTDDGHGMDLAKVAQGWLVISASLKRAHAGPKRTTSKFGRTPLGDKGLGRLSTMKLADLLTITTFTESSAYGIRISFRWSDFQSGVPLEKVELIREEVLKPAGLKSGTTIELVGLNDWEQWRKSQQRTSLSSSLSRLVNPFPSEDRFAVDLIYDGKEDLIDRLSEETLLRAAAEFHATWRRGQLPNFAHGAEHPSSFRLAIRVLLRPSLFLATNDKKESLLAKNKIISDKGRSFYEFLKQYPKTKGLQLDLNEKTGDLVVSETIGVDQVGSDPLYGSWAPPGAFDSKLYYFMLPQLDDEQERAEDGLKGKLRDRVSSMAGVYIFRDGFGIRSDRDWLRLGDSATSGSSFYGLRPNNVVGRVNLEGSKTDLLVETSNREHFVDNLYYRGFMVLNRRFVRSCNDVLSRVRRAAKDYLSPEDNKPTLSKNPTESDLQRLSMVTDDIRVAQRRFERFHSDAKTSISKIALSIADVRQDLLVDEKVQDLLAIVKEKLEEVGRSIEATNLELQDASRKAEHVSQLGGAVGQRFEQLGAQIENLYESAALGLSARGMAHEVATFLDEISSAAHRLKGKGGVSATSLVPIDRAIRSIRQYLAVLDPMLPGPRLRKESFALGEAVREYFDARSVRLNSEGIHVRLVDEQNAPMLKTSRGSVVQVLDNLVRNSEYWLISAVRQQPGRSAEIVLNFYGWGFSIEDTGPGVNRILEDEVFELFVSDKPGGERSGLGLYIVRAVLESMGGSIDLDEDRNGDGRRYRFNVRFGEAIKDGRK